eukprot:307025-Rhodomonas_salina.1
MAVRVEKNAVRDHAHAPCSLCVERVTQHGREHVGDPGREDEEGHGSAAEEGEEGWEVVSQSPRTPLHALLDVIPVWGVSFVRS